MIKSELAAALLFYRYIDSCGSCNLLGGYINIDG